MLRFTIRELVLVTAIVALAVGWWLTNRERMQQRTAHEELEQRHSALVLLLETSWKLKVEYTSISVIVDDPATGTKASAAWKWGR